MVFEQSSLHVFWQSLYTTAATFSLIGIEVIRADAAIAELPERHIVSEQMLNSLSASNFAQVDRFFSDQWFITSTTEPDFEIDVVLQNYDENVAFFDAPKSTKTRAIASPLPVTNLYFQPQPSGSHDHSITDQERPQSDVADSESIDASQSTTFAAQALALSEFSQTAGTVRPFPDLEIDERTDIVGQATNNADEVPWRFVLEPYIYLPFETNGDVTIRNTEVPFDFSLGDILESLTFAFYGRFEAWKGPWAFVLDGYYFDTVESDSRNIPAAALPPGLLPPQITQVPLDGTTETAFLKLDLAGAYRFGDGNLPTALSTAETDFDLGPFVFDAIAGLRLYSFSNDIELSTPLGLERDFSRSDTFIEPMIGGRARWNFADNLAAIAAANISGFGIGTDISVEGYTGVDWLFSGNTSLTATYRLTYIDYSEGSSSFNLFQHGPAVGVKFRF